MHGIHARYPQVCRAKHCTSTRASNPPGSCRISVQNGRERRALPHAVHLGVHEWHEPLAAFRQECKRGTRLLGAKRAGADHIARGIILDPYVVDVARR
eukprot:3186632-Prymnesium_polylepis.1